MALRSALRFVPRSTKRTVLALTRAHAGSQRLAGIVQGQTAAVRCASAGVRSFSAINVTFVLPSGDEVKVTGQKGDSLLDVAHEHDIDIEGACGGECACSTCHMILTEEVFESLEAPDEEEEDMLDLALGLTDTSRLGCQVILNESLDGIVVKIPAETHNLLADE